VLHGSKNCSKLATIMLGKQFTNRMDNLVKVKTLFMCYSQGHFMMLVQLKSLTENDREVYIIMLLDLVCSEKEKHLLAMRKQMLYS
jgi:hypothetical protein